MNVLIAGAGIGGLTAGLCLQHFGHQALILERASAIEEVGAGIQLSPNAMKVFAALGLADQLAKRAFAPEAAEFRMGLDGKIIFSYPLGADAVKVWGAPYLHIHRQDLIDVLSEAFRARGGQIHLGTPVTGYRMMSSSVSAILADNSTVDAEILVAADGVHSTIRGQMLGPEKLHFTGNVAWRLTVPLERFGIMAPPPPTACVWAGAGRHCVTYLIKGGKVANFVGVVERSDWRTESWSEKGTREEAQKDFAGWHPNITTMIDKADQHFRWALFDRSPLPRWTDGRVALLGDACHPMLPFMAQGAAMAIEDAWALAANLSAVTVPAEGLRRYQEARLTRASMVQAASRSNARTFHHRTGVMQALAFGPMYLAGRVAPSLIRHRLDAFYSFDVTKQPL